MAVLPPPITATRSPTGTLCSGRVWICSMKSSASTTSGKSSPGTPAARPAQAQPHEHGVELLLDLLGGKVLADFNPAAELHPQALDERHFLQAHLGPHLVVGDAVGVETAGLGLLLEYHDLVAELRQFGGAAKSSRPSANNRHALAGLRGGCLQKHWSPFPSAWSVA